MQETRVPLKPFLKWAGGKRWFVNHHAHLFPQFSGRYIEPFLGSGAVFFHLRPETSLLGDCNGDLIDTYQAIKDDWKAVVDQLSLYMQTHSIENYYLRRAANPNSKEEQAARFIYLNCTCWNGLYRVNLQGKFNVPVGTRTRTTIEDIDFQGISKILKKAKLHKCDFEALIDKAKNGDVLFIDPPYTVRHNNNGFVKYNETLFSWNDQERLAKSLIRAQKRKAYVVATNAFNENVRHLYKDHFELYQASRFSSIAGKVASRRDFEELIIVSPQEDKS